MSDTVSDGTEKVPWFFAWRSSAIYIKITLAIAFFVDTFYYGLVIPILPQLLHDRVDIEGDGAQLWTSVLLATYCVSQIIFGPFIGYLADRWENRRVPLLAGLFSLGIATGMFAFGRNVWLLFVARLLQGASAAVIWTAGLALLVDAVGSDNVAQSMSWVTISMSVGLTLGPLLGGIIYRRSGHYSVFIVAICILAVDLVLRILIIEKKEAKKIIDSEDERHADENVLHEESSLTFASNVSGPDSRSQGQSETSPLLPQEDRASAHKQERHSGLWTLLSTPELLIGVWAILTCNLTQTSLESVLPLYAEETFDWGSESSGIALLALMLPAFTGPIAGYLTDRNGARINTIFGLLCIGVGYSCLALITHKDTGIIALLGILLVVIGTGISFANVAQMSTIAGFAENMEKENPGVFGPAGATAQSCALINWAFATAGIVSPPLSGVLREVYGWRTLSIVMGSIALVSIVPMFWLRK